MSSYKHSHVMNNGLVYTPNKDKTTWSDILGGVAQAADAVHYNWYALPAEMRYQITGSDSALKEAVANGALNPDGSDTLDIEGFKQWRAMGNKGNYSDYQYEQQLERIKKIMKDEEEAEANAPVITSYEDPVTSAARATKGYNDAMAQNWDYGHSVRENLPDYYEEEAAADTSKPEKAIDDAQESAYDALFDHSDYFDPMNATEEEIKAKQEELGLPADGKWGKQSQAAYLKSLE